MVNNTILTGLRVNNDLTLGNYFGGMLPIIDMATSRADEFVINMFIPDLHSITTPVDYSQIQTQILQTAKSFIAAGLPINHPNVHMYRQSYIPAHSELTWILDCFTGTGQMSRMTQFKDKSSGREDVSVGLFNYPVLMAADILLYGARYVPVGDDQTQHLEFTRDIAERMNTRFGELFVVPEPVKKQHEFFGKEQGLRIMDLANPLKKMSKSDDSGKGVIFLSDVPSVAAKKIMAATTDDKAMVRFDRANQPGISNLIELLSLLRGCGADAIAQEFSGMTRYGDFKKVIASEVEVFLENFQRKVLNVEDATVISFLTSSEQSVAATAADTLQRVQEAVGLRVKGA